MDDGLEIVKRIWVVESMEEYASFYDQTWADEFDRTLHPTKLYSSAVDLILEWKAAAYTAAMPWQLVTSIPNFLKGCSLVPQTIPIAVPTMTPAEAWSAYMKIKGFGITLWGSQRICYGAIYHAYENCLVGCLAVASGQLDYRPKRIGKVDKRAPWETLKDDLNAHVAKSLGDECLGDENVCLARLIRNALAHKGGRTNQDIDSRNKCMQIEDGFVQIRPIDTRNLFNLLKHKVNRVAQAVRPLPSFVKPDTQCS